MDEKKETQPSQEQVKGEEQKEAAEEEKSVAEIVKEFRDELRQERDALMKERKRLEELQARDLLGGKSIGEQPEEEKELDPVAYSEKVLRGEV